MGAGTAAWHLVFRSSTTSTCFGRRNVDKNSGFVKNFTSKIRSQATKLKKCKLKGHGG